MRVLIVDDSAVLRKVIERALLQAGVAIEMIEANNGEKALEVLRLARFANSSFDLIISDINMPVMDGLDFLEQRQLEKLAPGVPAVIISSEDNAELAERAAAAGANGYICKPFTGEQMSRRVLPLLALAHAGR